MKNGLWFLLAFVIGIIPGFFLGFNFMFSDIVSPYERGLSFLVIVAVYIILGIISGFTVRNLGWKLGVFLCLPIIILALLYSFSEAGVLTMNLLYSTAALISSITGSHLGAELSTKQKQ